MEEVYVLFGGGIFNMWGRIVYYMEGTYVLGGEWVSSIFRKHVCYVMKVCILGWGGWSYYICECVLYKAGTSIITGRFVHKVRGNFVYQGWKYCIIMCHVSVYVVCCGVTWCYV